jgi:hypothetical protein
MDHGAQAAGLGSIEPIPAEGSDMPDDEKQGKSEEQAQEDQAQQPTDPAEEAELEDLEVSEVDTKNVKAGRIPVFKRE